MTCHSSPAKRVFCASTTAMVRNIAFDQRRAVSIILCVNVPTNSFELKSNEPCRTDLQLDQNKMPTGFRVDLTRRVILLKTGNVFARSTSLGRLDRITSVGFGAVIHDRSFSWQEISKMLRLARDQCRSAILPGRFYSRAQQKRLSIARGVRTGT